MTYNVFSGTLNPAQSQSLLVLNQFCLVHPFVTDLLTVDDGVAES